MIHSFLLIGQSNMSGRGFLDEACEIDSEHIYTLRMGRWVPMFRPINPDRRTAGVSLGESFAEKFAEKYGVDVGLISCADGGTCLDQWKKGEVLFEHAAAQAKFAMRTSEIKGILWHQGESDCSLEASSTYAKRLNRFIKDLREATGLYDVPFIIGALGDYLKDYQNENLAKYYTNVNEALKNVADSNELTGFVDASGLGANPDNLHFNSKSLYEFGIRYFDVFEKFNTVNFDNTSFSSGVEMNELEKL